MNLCTAVRRCLLTTVSALVFVLLAQVAARADCGKSQFSYFTPKAQAVEAMPINASTELQSNPANLTLAPREMAAFNLNAFISPCPDEPRPVDVALANVAALWRMGLIGQNELFWADAIQKGQTTTSSACAATMRSRARADVATAWDHISSASNYEFQPDMKVTYFAALKRSPDYNHVTRLLSNVAHEAGITLPQVDYTANTWVRSYQQAALTASAHAPEGVNCFVLNPARK